MNERILENQKGLTRLPLEGGSVKRNVRPHVMVIKHFGEYFIRRIIYNFFFVQGETLNNNIEAACEN